MTATGQTYATRQKRDVQAVIDGLDRPFTVQDIRARLEELRSDVSRASTYRAVQSLCLAGRIKQIALPDGRRIFARAVEGSALCIIECADCGSLSSCSSTGFDQCFNAEALRRSLNPLQTATYMRAKCELPQCHPSKGSKNAQSHVH
jgi:Fe2+ or Zn2+ uptake regulation protein